jgi:Cd2+/Zn2+-exporting ATPase
VTTGASAVNQAPITGESMPVEKAAGDAVFAGTVNERGAFEFRVTANKGNTTLDRIIHTVQEAQGQRAPTQSFVDQFAKLLHAGGGGLRGAGGAVPPLFFGAAFLDWFYKALVMLVIACPCALVISTPVTVVSGLAAAARHGILVKGGVHLENGRRIKAVALDKTGTLTHGRPAADRRGAAERPAARRAAATRRQRRCPFRAPGRRRNRCRLAGTRAAPAGR